MKLITSTLLSLFTLGAPFAAYAETLTIEGSLKVEGDIEAGSTSAFGRYSVVNSSSNTIGAIEAPDFDSAFLYIANSNTEHKLGLDPNQIVGDVSTYLHIWNANPTGGILFRTGGSDAVSRAVYIDKSGKLGIGTDTPTAKLDVNGDVKVQGDLDVQGQLLFSGESAVYNDSYISSKGTFARDAFFSSELNNFLYAADKRYVITQVGQSSGNVGILFDGTDQSGAAIQIAQDQEYQLTLDFTALKDGTTSVGGITYAIGEMYANFYHDSIPTSVRFELYYKNVVSPEVYDATPFGSKSSTWRASFPHTKAYLQKIEVFIIGGSDTKLQEVTYHLKRPSGRLDAYLSKYKAEKLHYPLSFYDGNYAETIKLDSSTGTITAVDLEVTGELIVTGGSSVILNGSASDTQGAIRYTLINGFEGYVDDGANTPDWVSLTSGGSGSGEAYKLTTPNENTDVIVVDGNGDTTVSGIMTFAAPMGDIPMFGQ